MSTDASKMTITEFFTLVSPPLNLLFCSETNPNPATFEEVIHRIRFEIDAAVQIGFLPAGTKCSVRKRSHRDLVIEIVAWSGAVFSTEYIESVMDPKVKFDDYERTKQMRAQLSPFDWSFRRAHLDARRDDALNLALSKLEAIGQRHNYDRSDSQSDYSSYGYSLDVICRTVELHAMRGLKLESDPKHAELVEKARRAVDIVGKSYARVTLGRGGIEAAGDWALNKLVDRLVELEAYASKHGLELAEVAMVYAPRARRWEPGRRPAPKPAKRARRGIGHDPDDRIQLTEIHNFRA